MLTVLTIAGFDPSGGAGVLADIKTFAAQGCYGLAAITALTAQNTRAVFASYPQSAEVLRAQLEPLIDDFEIAAVKIGMLPTRAAVETVAELIAQRGLPNVVLDPLIHSSSGFELIDQAARDALIQTLLPLVRLVTPNLAEAEALAGVAVKNPLEMADAARRIRALCGPTGAVLVKGGHLEGEAVDLLDDGTKLSTFSAPRLATPATHGTGCTLSSAIAARLAYGDALETAVARAKAYVIEAMRAAPALGGGAGPLNHFVKMVVNGQASASGLEKAASLL